MTHRQELFIAAYLGAAKGNASEAARQAGYSEANAGSYGGWLTKNPAIRARIGLKLEEVGSSAADVLGVLQHHTAADPMWFYDIDEHTGRPRLNLAKPEARENSHLIKEIVFDKDGTPVGVKLHDAQNATIHLGKYHALFTDKIEGRLKVVNEFEAMTDEQLEQHAQRLREQAGTADPGSTG